MYRINWSKFDGDSFQSFCNDLFDFEFGVNYVPFNAPGGDGGVDGLFNGQYGKFSGNWRIQAKYKAPSTGRQNNIDSLKSDLRKELRRKGVDQLDHFLLITNVEVGPKKQKELLSVSNEVIQELQLNVTVHIWDDAKIATVLTHHPILASKYIEDYDSELIEYRDYFSKQLTDEVELVNQMDNNFYFREDKISDLIKFVDNSNNSIACLSGSAGMGKTRTVIELFNKLKNNYDNWVPLVLSSTNFDLIRVQRNLRGKRNYVVLLDDADRFSNQLLEELVEASTQSPNRIKFIFTVRLSLVESFLGGFSSRWGDKILKIQLEKFTPEETWELLRTELKNYNLEPHKASFINITNGVPIIILSLIDTVRNMKGLHSIKDDDFLKRYVFEHFKKVGNIAFDEFDIRKSDFDKILNTYVLIEPINIKDDKVVQIISETEGVKIEQVFDLLEYFDREKIIIGRGGKVIKPDLYSDFILSKALTKRLWLKNKLTEYSSFTYNIAINLGYLYNQEDEAKRTIHEILKEYVEQIDSVQSTKELGQILDVTRFLSHVEEEHATNAIKKVLSAYENDDHPLNNELVSYIGRNSYASFLPFVNDLKSIIRSLFQSEDYWKFAINISERFHLILGEEDLITNIARYGNEDRFNGFDCEHQMKVPTLIEEKIKADPQSFKRFHFKLLKALLKLDVNDVSNSVTQRHALTITTIYIPDNEHVRLLRNKIIDLLIRLFENEEIENDLRHDIFLAISDIPREIMSVKDKTKYEGVELVRVLDFIENVGSTNYLSLKSKHKLKKSLYWFIRWGIDEKYHSQIAKIKAQLEGGSISEELMRILNPGSEYFKENESIDSDALSFIQRNESKDIGIALIDVIENSEHYPQYLYRFNRILSGDLGTSVNVLKTIWEEKGELLFNHFTDVLGALRFSMNFEDEYWHFISLLEDVNQPNTRSTILNVYASRSINTFYDGDNPGIKKEDTDLITRIIELASEENYHQLACSIPTLLWTDVELAKTEILKFLDYCRERDFEYLLLSLESFEGEHQGFIEILIFDHSIKFNLNYRLEKLLAEYINKFGFSQVLDYFENRFLHRRYLVSANNSSGGYDFIWQHENGTLKNKIKDELRLVAFEQSLYWYLSFEFEKYESYFGKSIVEAFKPVGAFNTQTKEIFERCFEEFKNDFEKLFKLTEVLNIFKRKNSEFISMISKFVLGINQQSMDTDQIKDIQSNLYIAVTSLGVKSGTPGQPFQVDLELRELLKAEIQKNEFESDVVISFLNRVLGSVERDIERDTEEEDESW